MKIKYFICIMILIILLTFSVNAVTLEEIVLNSIFTLEDQELKEIFSDSFLQQISFAQLHKIIIDYQQRLGELRSVKSTNDGYQLQFEAGTLPVRITLNNQQKVISLWFGNYTLQNDNLSNLLAEFKKIPGQVSLLITKNNQQQLLAYHEKQKLAVASSFKLYLLKELYNKILSDSVAWSDIIELTAADRSLPTGILQDWPPGTPLTLRTLSNLMISESDNTAADCLFNYLGRDKLENNLTTINIPFLKTSEVFYLKYVADQKLQQKYLTANFAGKRKILSSLNNKDLKEAKFADSPILIDKIEWYFSTAELSDLIYDLRSAPELAINSGLVNKSDYYLAAYKGGSEPGVLQFTQLLQKVSNGDIYVFSVTVNNNSQDVDLQKIAGLTNRLINVIINNGK